MNTIIEKNIKKIKKYCKECNVEELFVFGSAVSGNFTENSDIDFLVKFNDMPAVKYTNSYFSLLNKLIEIFGENIDLITERALNNPFFIESIEKNKKLLYAIK